MNIADDGDTTTRNFQSSRVKALFRRGTARERLSDPRNAAIDFRAAATAATVGVELAVAHVRDHGSTLQRR